MGLTEETEKDTSGHGGADNSRHIRPHGVHQQVVARVELAADNLGDPGAVGDGGHAGVADQRVDLPVSLQEQVPEFHEQDSDSRGYHEREKTEKENLQGIPCEELVRLG